jgi:hypothetical protein
MWPSVLRRTHPCASTSSLRRVDGRTGESNSSSVACMSAIPLSPFPFPSSQFLSPLCVPCTWRPALELRTWARWRRTTHVLTRATARSLSPVSTVALCVLPDCGLAGSLGCVALPKEAAGPQGSDMRAAASDGGATRGGPAEGGGWSWALDLLGGATALVPMGDMTHRRRQRRQSRVKYQETPSGTHGHTVLTPPR